MNDGMLKCNMVTALIGYVAEIQIIEYLKLLKKELE
jgi:hypothetical protein